MKIVYLGTPEFAISCLNALVKSKHQVVAVVTQPDKPSERGNKVQFSEVKKYALSHNLVLFQFPKISRDGIIDLKALQPDIMITCAYGQILSQEILDIARFGVINVHASLLPKYRGASPIQSAVMNGDTVTGITIMKTEIGLDTGDIISSVSTPIFENETAGELSSRLSGLAAGLLLETLDKIQNGTATYTQQEHVNATVTKKIEKEDCIINWKKSSKEIKCLILGANPNPVARTLLDDKIVKLYKAELTDLPLTEKQQKLECGTVLNTNSNKSGIFVKTGDGAIKITELQLPGGKVLSAKDILNGRKILPGNKFTSALKIDY